MNSESYLSPEEVQKLIKELSRRLFLLEQRRARFGYNTPPEVLAEIEDITKRMESLRSYLNAMTQQPSGVPLQSSPHSPRRKDDLEKHIRESYKLVREYEEIQRLSDDPKEQARAGRAIEEQWKLINGYLAEYVSLCQQLRLAMPGDITEIAVIVGVALPQVPSTQPPSEPTLRDALARISNAEATRYDVFVSYSHRDEDWVQNWLLPRLEDADIRVCIDFRDFEPGAPSLTEMEQAVLHSHKTLLVFTPDYLASEWAEFEGILAQNLDPAARQRRLIPLLLKSCELPLRIRTLTYLDFTKAERWGFQLDRLTAAIRTRAAVVQSQPLEPQPQAIQPDTMSEVESAYVGQPTTQVIILLQKEIQQFTSAERESFVFALSRIVNVHPDQIRILHVLPGSVQVTLEMPEEAAKLLVSMYLASDPVLQTLRIAKVELRQVSSLRKAYGQKAAVIDAHALLIGIGDYIHPRFASLPATVRDAQAVAAVLIDPARCGYQPDNVHMLTGEQATAANIRAALKSLAQSTHSLSTVFIYFSGHGGRALENGVWRTYLCPREADPDNLAQTAVPGDEFSALLATIPARKLLVMLDACHAGGSIDLKAADGSLVWKAGLSEDYYEALSQGSGRVVIASSKEEQFSYIRGDLSLFTRHLVQALNGKAAVRGDGLIHVLDVFHYVNEAVQADEPKQVPILKVKDLDLNFPIALDRGGKGAGLAPAVPDIVAIREQIVRGPIAGAKALSDYLATRPELSAKRNEVDLKRSDLERIQHELDLFGPDPGNQAAKNQTVYYLLRVCLELERPE